MTAKPIDHEVLWDNPYDDEAVLYNDALICLQEAEILSASEDVEDLDEASNLVEIAARLLDSLSSISTDALEMRAVTLEKRRSIR